jgi:D-serine deaminase-like pyridoxal phosphate-dependent protein
VPIERPLPPLPSGLDTPGLVVFVDRSRPTSSGCSATLMRVGSRFGRTSRPTRARISRMQLDAGAAGLTVGTLGEAEVLASAGSFRTFASRADGPKVAAARRPRVGRQWGSSAAAAERLAAAVDGPRCSAC